MSPNKTQKVLNHSIYCRIHKDTVRTPGCGDMAVGQRVARAVGTAAGSVFGSVKIS